MSTKEFGCYVGTVTIDEIDHVLEKRRRKTPNARRQRTSRRQLRPSRRLTKLQTAGCKALTKDVIYTLDEDEQDALGNTTPSAAQELEELRATLPDWLHDMADAFSKKAADTLPQSRPFDHKLRFDGPEPLIKSAYLYRIST